MEEDILIAQPPKLKNSNIDNVLLELKKHFKKMNIKKEMKI